MANALRTIELLLAAGARLPEDQPLAELLGAPLPLVRRMLELGARADLPDDEARTALHVAVRPMTVTGRPITEALPRLELVRLLLEHGVALDVADGQGQTALALALAEEAAAPDDEHRRAMAEVIAILHAAGAPLAASGERTARRGGARLEELGEPTTYEELSARHAGAPWLRWFLETRTLVTHEPEPRLLRGDLRLTRDLRSGDGPWAMILEGDLETSGDLDFTTGDYAVSTLIVLGDVRARNVSFSSSARVSITGNLLASGIITGSGGDSGACLGTDQLLTARAVLLDEHTSISAADGAGFRALLVGARGWQEFNPTSSSIPRPTRPRSIPRCCAKAASITTSRSSTPPAASVRSCPRSSARCASSGACRRCSSTTPDARRSRVRHRAAHRRHTLEGISDLP